MEYKAEMIVCDMVWSRPFELQRSLFAITKRNRTCVRKLSHGDSSFLVSFKFYNIFTTCSIPFSVIKKKEHQTLLELSDLAIKLVRYSPITAVLMNCENQGWHIYQYISIFVALFCRKLYIDNNKYSSLMWLCWRDGIFHWIAWKAENENF